MPSQLPKTTVLDVSAEAQAYQINTKTDRGEDAAAAVRDIRRSLAREAELRGGETWEALLCPSRQRRPALAVGLGVALSHQVSGVNAVQYFLLSIVEASGVSSRSGQYGCLVFFGLLKLLFVLVAARLFDSCGRRPLMLASSLGMALSLAVVALNFRVHHLYHSIHPRYYM